MIQWPCRGCEKRYPGCHGKCEDYLKMHRERQEYLDRRLQEGIADSYIVEEQRKSLDRAKNHFRGHKHYGGTG